jgi:hypothetical protein
MAGLNLACTSVVIGPSMDETGVPYFKGGRDKCPSIHIHMQTKHKGRRIQRAVAHDGVPPCPPSLYRFQRHTLPHSSALYPPPHTSRYKSQCAYLHHLSRNQSRRMLLLHMHVQHAPKNSMNQPAPTHFPTTPLPPIPACSLIRALLDPPPLNDVLPSHAFWSDATEPSYRNSTLEGPAPHARHALNHRLAWASWSCAEVKKREEMYRSSAGGRAPGKFAPAVGGMFGLRSAREQGPCVECIVWRTSRGRPDAVECTICTCTRPTVWAGRKCVEIHHP